MGKDITEVARKQRHLSLLEKVRANQTLSTVELSELKRYERALPKHPAPPPKPAPKGKKKVGKKSAKRARSNRKSQIANRKSAKRLPFSAKQTKSLAFEHGALTVADQHTRRQTTLAKAIAAHPKLKTAWERGLFLRNLREEAASSPSLSRAAGQLGMTGRALRDLLDSDYEANDLWRSERLDLAVEQNKRIFELAGDGVAWAVRQVEEFLKTADESRPTGGLDHRRLMQKDIAELFGVTRVTVREWTERNHCPRNTDGSYNIADVIRWHTEFTRRKATGGRLLPADELRDLKAADKRLDIEQRRGNLLDRGEVMAGLMARWRAIVGACRYKARELASLVHGQTIENIEAIFSRFFEDLQQQWLDVPVELQLEPDVEGRFLELLDSLKPRTAEDKKEDA